MFLSLAYLISIIFLSSCSDGMKIEVKGITSVFTERNSLEVMSLELTDGSGVNESATETTLSWSEYVSPEEELNLSSIVSYQLAYKAGRIAPKDCSSDNIIKSADISGISHTVTNLVESDTYSFRVCALDKEAKEVAVGTQTVKFESWELEVTTLSANEVFAIGFD